jgi:CRISPR-associated protein Cas6
MGAIATARRERMSWDDSPAASVDVAFGVQGTAVPRHHRALLAAALDEALPWLATDERCGVHRLNLAHASGGDELVSPRTRLLLRVPREHSDDALALSGRSLDLAGHVITVGAGHVRELLAHGTLYAHFVATDVAINAADEAAFLAAAESELAHLGVRGRAICGRWQSLESNALVGCSLMVDRLAPADSVRLLERGLGRHRRLGCGLFVPHKSSAAVGVPD